MSETTTGHSVEHVYAPWVQAQIDSLNGFQEAGCFHPFTCGNDHPGSNILVATKSGWVCPGCDYTQNWAYPYMADRSAWSAHVEKMNAFIAARFPPDDETTRTSTDGLPDALLA